jgi:putative glutathione S-transferase
MPEVGRTVDMRHIKLSYYSSMTDLNHFAIIPSGPNFIETLKEPHDRDRFNK